MEYQDPNSFSIRPGIQVATLPAGFVLTPDIAGLLAAARIEKGSVLSVEETVMCQDHLAKYGPRDHGR